MRSTGTAFTTNARGPLASNSFCCRSLHFLQMQLTGDDSCGTINTEDTFSSGGESEDKVRCADLPLLVDIVYTYTYTDRYCNEKIRP